ncbi:hypothetical protein VC_1818 [Vibrio cholerae O1 biovar El Tor str. N16961]|uniref:Uncharacterized protein n=2 Tax=Vibrio cholerae TaxID=666 RepID=Q9KR29_VIBCH|nr:hypothetical protein VC_1818 [Vibrio cholerae O1 biovar El Tor str. N16961]ACP06047.1 conserved hypothetical protein [Vibrio cholerae M66-2]ACP09927.1 conserved hypothetical protein [Vibrio cholerae O395]ACQ60722.1 hypothetical protein VCD_002556 [Vibrio cholerae MJ-1236]EEO08481.1 hypothetical protein VCC_002842 [Vibrio cholerae RC9]EEO16584.1 hypothetical protein VCE_003087 [Vibrio cholerae B33]EEO20509.1 hypothetical protein VCF_003317 [Vibrio cholerae BX 330286]
MFSVWVLHSVEMHCFIPFLLEVATPSGSGIPTR